MTNVAIDSLIHNSQLENLFISGRITKEAARKLKRLPRLSRLQL